MVNLASLLLCEGKGAQARDVLEATIDRQTAQLGPAHPDISTSLNILAEAQLQLGDATAAEQNLLRAVQMQTASFSADHPVLALTKINLASLLVKQGRPAAALPLYRQAETSLVKAFGEQSAPVRRVREELSKLSDRQ